jgi:hypothetical protein
MSNRSAIRQVERERRRRRIREARQKAQLAAWKAERRQRRLGYIFFWRRHKPPQARPKVEKPRRDREPKTWYIPVLGVLRLATPGVLGIAIIIYRISLGPRVAWIMLFMAAWCGGVALWRIRRSAWNKLWLYGTFAALYAGMTGFLLAH